MYPCLPILLLEQVAYARLTLDTALRLETKRNCRKRLYGMPAVSKRQQLIQEPEDVLQLLSCHYTLLLQFEYDTLLVDLGCADSSTESSERSSTTASRETESSSDISTSSSLSVALQQLILPSSSEAILEAVKIFYQLYEEVVSHCYLDRTYGCPRHLHLKRDELFDSLLKLEPRAFRYMVRYRLSWDTPSPR
jgi:hypothetical protein